MNGSVPPTGSEPDLRRLTLATAIVTVLLLAGIGQAQLTCRVGKLTAFDGAPLDSFGYAVSVSGGAVFIGADQDGDNAGNSGSVYVYTVEGTTWSLAQKLLASDGGGSFGNAVSADGHRVMIAAVGGDAVYAFALEGPNWVEQQKLEAPDKVAGDGFAYSVSISGDLVVVGSWLDGDNGASSGSAYVFRLDPQSAQWVFEQKFLASDGASGDFFGWSVAVRGDIAVIGAPGVNGCSGFDAGAAYVFRFEPQSSLWVEEAKLVSFDCSGGDHFGLAVSASEGVTLIGARYEDGNSPDSGAAYVFRYEPQSSQWVQEQKLQASDGQPSDKFGRSVAIDGDTALVGAWNDDDVGPNLGSAYVFRHEGAAWVQKDKMLPDPGAWTAFFGWAVAVDGDTGVVGAHGENGQRGSAYVYAGLGGTDCNASGSADVCDILLGFSADADGDGTPDECACPWDLDREGTVNCADFLSLLDSWGANPGSPADFDGDGGVGITDFLALLGNWGPCP